jgi:hypothetical protein
MSASVEKKRRRNALAFAAIFAAFQAYIGHRAQTEHTVIRFRKMPVDPTAKMAVLRRGLAGARPSIMRSTRALGLGQTLFKE